METNETEKKLPIGTKVITWDNCTGKVSGYEPGYVWVVDYRDGREWAYQPFQVKPLDSCTDEF